MARSETAQIIVQVRGAVKAAQETERVADAQDELGDEVDESGRAALRASGAFERMQAKLRQVTRSSILNTGAVSMNTVALAAMLAVVLGLAITALPALVAVLGASTTAVVAFGGALIGLGVGLGLIAVGAVMRFKETAEYADSAAYALKTVAGELRDTFAAATAGGADKIFEGLAVGMRELLPLTRSLEPMFTAIGGAIGDWAGDFGKEMRSLGPEIRDLFGQMPDAIGPLGDMLTHVVAMLIRIANVAMPMLIDGLEWLDEKAVAFTDGFTDRKVNDALGVLKTTFEGIAAVVGGIADTLGPEIGPALESMSAAFAGNGSEIGQAIGLILAAFVAIGKGALPGLIEGVVSLGDAFGVLVDSGTAEWIGTVVGDAFATAAGAIAAVLGHLNDVGALRPMIIALAAAFAIWKVAIIAVSLAMAMNPAVALGMALTAIGLAVVYAYHRFETFRAVVDGVWSWIRDHFLLLPMIISGPLTAIPTLVIANLGTIIDFVKGMPGRIAAAATGMWEGLKSGLNAVLKSVIDAINLAIDGINQLNPFGDIAPVAQPGMGDNAPGDSTGRPRRPSARIPGAPPVESFGGGNVLLRALGGPIPGGGPYRDRIPALLTPGEHVLTRGEVANAGGHRGVMQIRSALESGGLRGALAGAGTQMPDVHVTIPLQIGEREVGRAAARVSLRERALQGETG